jgi:hypothetical protein
MSELTIAASVFASVFGAALLGLFLGNALPEHHVSQDSKDVVKLGTALIATMAALVLSLLISSAKGEFDKVNGELVEIAARAISLDRALADYGRETKEVRELLRRSYAARMRRLFPAHEQVGKEDSPGAVVGMERIPAKLWELSPQSDAQHGLRSQALAITSEMAATRWLLLIQEQESIPLPLLLTLTAWLAIIFATFGLFAPRNATVVAALFICALSVSGAILLILEMSSPFTGFIKISSAPMRAALVDLGR